METSIHIQQAGLEFFDVAFDLLQRFFREEGFDTSTDEMLVSLRAVLTNPHNAVFLAWRGDEAVGVATASTSLGVELGRVAELDDLYVSPDARRNGVAGQLIAAVRDWGRRAGCTRVQLVVTPEGDAAHHLVDFYQRRGFVNTGRVVLAYRL